MEDIETTTNDPNLFTLFQNVAQLSPLFINGTGRTDDHNDNLKFNQFDHGPTMNPDIEQLTQPPLLNRNANEILKFNASPISTSIVDDGADSLESSSYASYVVPLKIILPVDHVHKSAINDSYQRYGYILLKVDDVSYHEHINSDNSEILFPVDRFSSPMDSSTLGPDNDNNHDTTTTAAMINNIPFDGDKNSERSSESAEHDKNDIVLVDSQGYHYELKKHFRILGEFETTVVEFDDIAMIRPKVPNKPNKELAKRILSDDVTTKSTNRSNDIDTDQYQGHYAKIFQWLHYHL